MAVYFNDFLITLLGISLTMSAVSALLMLLRRPMKKYFKAGSRFVIWALIMVRLCIPVGGVLFPSAVNIAEFSKSSSVTEEDFSYVVYDGQDPDALIPEIESPPIRDGDVSSAPNAADKAETNESTPDGSSAMITAETVSTVLFAMWAAGALAFILKYILRYNISAGYIRKSLREPDSSVKMLFDEICAEMKLKRRPRLAVSEAVDSPMLFGYFKSTVVMPDVSFTDEAARGIISHELTHYKRGDLYLKLIAMIGNAFHWFNPIAYIASKIFAREMELSCDEKVLMLYDDEMRVNYGRIMLGIVANCRKNDAPLTTGFNPRANAVKERISNILDSHAKHKGSVFISMTLAVCISAGSLFGYNVSAYDGSAAEDTRRESGTEAETVYSEDTQSVSEPEAADTAEADDSEPTTAEPETTDAPEGSQAEPPETSADAPA